MVEAVGKRILRLKEWWGAPAIAFEKAYHPRNNAIGFIRLCLASLVIVSHAYPLGGLYGKEIIARFSSGQSTLGALAVSGFFILSGFLIAGSYDHLKSTGRFLWHRFLRIMPGFWVALLVGAFGFGALFYYHYNHTLAGYFNLDQGGALSYISSNFFLTMNQYDISGLTKGLSHSGALNGSLWTLSYEFECYLIIALMGFFGIFNKSKRFVLAACFSVYILFVANTLYPASINHISPFLQDGQLLGLLTTFLCGAVFYLYRHRIQLDNKYFVLGCLILIYTLRTGGFAIVMPLILSYVLMYMAAFLPIKSFDRKYDLSYGIYIYAFPVQQTFSLYGLNKLNIVYYCLLAFAATVPLAFLSYVLIEKPSMLLKNKNLRLSGNQIASLRSSYTYVRSFMRAKA